MTPEERTFLVRDLPAAILVTLALVVLALLLFGPSVFLP